MDKNIQTENQWENFGFGLYFKSNGSNRHIRGHILGTVEYTFFSRANRTFGSKCMWSLG